MDKLAQTIEEAVCKFEYYGKHRDELCIVVDSFTYHMSGMDREVFMSLVKTGEDDTNFVANKKYRGIPVQIVQYLEGSPILCVAQNIIKKSKWDND